MLDFKELGYDKQVTLYVKVPPVDKYSEETYEKTLINNCQVIVDHKHNIKSNGTENANKISVNFLCVDNPDINITDDMLNSAVFAIGSGADIPDDNAYTLTSFNHESVLLPHYELGGM